MSSLYQTKWLPLVAMLAVANTSCDRDSKPGAATSPAEGEAATNRIDIPASVRNNIGITFAKVERRAVSATLRVPGAFELKPLAKHEYRLMLPAQVRFEVDEFQKVEPGTLLYRFQSPQWLELQSRIDVAMTGHQQATLKYEALATRIEALAKADFKRADLEADAAGLRAEMARQRTELDAALATAAGILNTYGRNDDILTAEELLEPVKVNGSSVPRYRSISWIEARAIEPGIVGSLNITDGTFVDETTLVVTTVDPSQIRFRALGLQSDLEKFNQAGARIVPHQAAGGDLNDGVPAELTLGLDGHPSERTITLLANPKEVRPWARPGVSAFLEITTASSGGPVLAIPRSAVVKDGITHVFFKRDPLNPNKAIRVEADLGVNDGRWIEVKSDLGPNDEVVLEGAYELKLATAQSGTSQKGGHFHADGTYHGKH
jgi:hypothetical protein